MLVAETKYNQLTQEEFGKQSRLKKNKSWPSEPNSKGKGTSKPAPKKDSASSNADKGTNNKLDTKEKDLKSRYPEWRFKRTGQQTKTLMKGKCTGGASPSTCGHSTNPRTARPPSKPRIPRSPSPKEPNSSHQPSPLQRLLSLSAAPTTLMTMRMRKGLARGG